MVYRRAYKRRYPATNRFNLYKKRFFKKRRYPFKRTMFKRRFPYRKKFVRRVPFRRPGPSAYFGAKKEIKFIDSTNTHLALTSAGVIRSSLHNLVQGVAEEQRVGRKVNLTSINFSYTIRLQLVINSAEASDVVRIIVYQDKQCNGAAATVFDLLETADVLSHRNLRNVGRFNFLMDRSHNVQLTSAVGDGTTNAYGAYIKKFTFNKKVSIPIEFDGAAGVLTEIQSNNIGIMFMSHLSGATDVITDVRCRYSDA